ncbi:DUF4162 domain-containing protein, partial [Patescibacteria group bacterium]|nr:DUF4162 domain-containing protein [Patescibacteria group bacterium]
DPLPQNIVYKMFQEVTDKGTTVFTSSHNLAEVQKVCDRVAIIKNGQMVTTESIASLKEKKINTVRAYFGEDFDLNDFKFKDVEIIRTIDHELLFKVKGEINEIVKALAKYRIKDLEITEASLEDIFLEYYE